MCVCIFFSYLCVLFFHMCTHIFCCCCFRVRRKADYGSVDRSAFRLLAAQLNCGDGIVTAHGIIETLGEKFKLRYSRVEYSHRAFQRPSAWVHSVLQMPNTLTIKLKIGLLMAIDWPRHEPWTMNVGADELHVIEAWLLEAKIWNIEIKILRWNEFSLNFDHIFDGQDTSKLFGAFVAGICCNCSTAPLPTSHFHLDTTGLKRPVRQNVHRRQDHRAIFNNVTTINGCCYMLILLLFGCRFCCII